MNIHFPQDSQIPQLRRLWKEAFQISDEFINLFFKTAFHPQRCLCVTKNEELLAVLYWFDCQCMNRPVAYIYGVATAKSYRKQGICRRLMDYAHLYLAELGYQGTLLVPEYKELFSFYENMGYKICCNIREFHCEAVSEELIILPIDKIEYARLRKLLLPKGSVIQEKENLDFLQTQANFYMGLGFLLAAHKENDSLYGIELLGDASAAPAILYALDCKKGTFRTPGQGRPFSMYYSLENSSLPSPSYFGFAFD